MSLSDIWALIQQYGGTAVTLFLVLSGLVEIAPIKVNPWSAVIKWFGANINANVVGELAEVRKRQEEIKKTLDDHIQMDDERNADSHRYRILRFNTELHRAMPHTEEEFNEIMYNMRVYKTYCKEHPDYENHRAVLAMENIDRVYKLCEANHDFL